jgi:hypothetical protein
MKMAVEKDEDFADLINSHTRMDWDLMSTGELIINRAYMVSNDILFVFLNFRL